MLMLEGRVRSPGWETAQIPLGLALLVVLVLSAAERSIPVALAAAMLASGVFERAAKATAPIAEAEALKLFAGLVLASWLFVMHGPSRPQTDARSRGARAKPTPSRIGLVRLAR